MPYAQHKTQHTNAALPSRLGRRAGQRHDILRINAEPVANITGPATLALTDVLLVRNA